MPSSIGTTARLLQSLGDDRVMGILAKDGFIGTIGQCPEFDAEKYKLDYLCLKDGHEWGSTKQSLRRVKDGFCVRCDRQHQRDRDKRIKQKKQEWIKSERRSLEDIHQVDRGQYFLGDICGWRHRFQGLECTLRSLADGNCVECHTPNPSFDESKYKLGSLCPLHEWGSTQMSLRNIKGGRCILCARERAKQQRTDPGQKDAIEIAAQKSRSKTREDRLQKRRSRYESGKVIRDLAQAEYVAIQASEADHVRLTINTLHKRFDIDTDRFTLGKTCRYKHLFNTTSFSLRYVKCGGSCVICTAESTKKKRKRRKQKYGKFFLGSLCQYGHSYEDLQKSLRRSDCGSCTECYKTIKANKRHKRRAKEMLNHSMPYSAGDIDDRMAQFNDECAYCGVELGSTFLATLDHFIAINNGGSDCIGNIVPSCRKCNSSKSDRDPFEWFESQHFYSRTRWSYILKILSKTQRNYQVIPLF